MLVDCPPLVEALVEPVAAALAATGGVGLVTG